MFNVYEGWCEKTFPVSSDGRVEGFAPFLICQTFDRPHGTYPYLVLPPCTTGHIIALPKYKAPLPKSPKNYSDLAFVSESNGSVFWADALQKKENPEFETIQAALNPPFEILHRALNMAEADKPILCVDTACKCSCKTPQTQVTLAYFAVIVEDEKGQAVFERDRGVKFISKQFVKQLLSTPQT